MHLMKYRFYEYPKKYSPTEKKYYTDYEQLAKDMVRGLFPKAKEGKMDVVFKFPRRPSDIITELEDGLGGNDIDINSPRLVREASEGWCEMLKDSSDIRSFVVPAIVEDCYTDEEDDHDCYVDMKWTFLRACADEVEKITKEAFGK